MNYGHSGGKRQREADRDRRNKDKADRLRRNREMRRRNDGAPGGGELGEPVALAEVKLEDIVIGVPSRPRRDSSGPVKLFVGGLSWDTTSEALRVAFARFGPVVEAVLIQDRETGRSRGFGFVTFESSRDADEAVKQMSGAELDGRTLKVNRAEAR
jgi:RNA recognition motif-containing protein